jgi:hypothetical protein
VPDSSCAPPWDTHVLAELIDELAAIRASCLEIEHGCEADLTDVYPSYRESTSPQGSGGRAVLGRSCPQRARRAGGAIRLTLRGVSEVRRPPLSRFSQKCGLKTRPVMPEGPAASMAALNSS